MHTTRIQIDGDTVPQSLVSTASAHIERTARPLQSPDPAVIDAALHTMGMSWIEGFIMSPHPDLGRSGAVCPFAHASYATTSLYATALDVADFSFSGFVQLMMQMPGVYRRVMAANDLSPTLFALIIFLQGLDRENYHRFIDVTQTITKPVFMQAGLMVGEFHPESRVPGVHSAQIFPMRNPSPAFVIRSIAPHDSLFIDRPSSPTALRIHELECYLTWAKLPPQKREDLERRLAELRGDGAPGPQT